MKKKAVVGLCCLLLSGCVSAEEGNQSTVHGEKLVHEDVILTETGSSFYPIPSLSLEEAVFLVEQEIRASFFGEHNQEFLSKVGRSLEESKRWHSNTIWMETGNVLAQIWSEYPDVDTQALVTEVLGQMFQKLAYRVDSAVEDGETGDIILKILVAPMGAVSFATEDFVQEYFYQVIESVDVLALTMEEYVYYDNLASQGLLVKILENTREMTYGKEQELSLRLVKAEDGYQMDEEDWYQIRHYSIDYTGHYQ